MLALQKEARRFLIRTSGRLERSLMDSAEKIAEERGAKEITSEDLVMAIRVLASDNVALFQSLTFTEGKEHVGRLAG